MKNVYYGKCISFLCKVPIYNQIVLKTVNKIGGEKQQREWVGVVVVV